MYCGYNLEFIRGVDEIFGRGIQYILFDFYSLVLVFVFQKECKGKWILKYDLQVWKMVLFK